jgi:hypothetical protein
VIQVSDVGIIEGLLLEPKSGAVGWNGLPEHESARIPSRDDISLDAGPG